MVDKPVSSIVYAGDTPSLREYLESRLVGEILGVMSEIKVINEKLVARDDAVKLQADANNVHFLSLNHEAARIQQAQAASVSRDTWDEYLKNDTQWKEQVERRLQNSLPRPEFQLYKDATDKALLLKTGQAQGIGLSVNFVIQLVTTIAGIGAIIGVILATKGP